MIAATAIEIGAVLITNDTKDIVHKNIDDY